MIEVVRSENFRKEKSRLRDRIIKMAKKHPMLDALIEISHKDKLMTVTCDPATATRPNSSRITSNGTLSPARPRQSSSATPW